jgi:hypothetical protein
MDTAIHKVTLTSEQHFGERIPPHYVGLLLAEIPLAVRDALSMALRNRSRVKGRQPVWLERAADIRFLGHEGNGVTTLLFEAPLLGNAAREIYQQQELPGLSTRPSRDDTGFDLLSDVLVDVQDGNADSEHFDPQLLDRVLKFQKVLDRRSPFAEIGFAGHRYPVSSPAVFSQATILSANSMLRRTPASQRVRITGELDALEASTQRFGVLLDSGEKVTGFFSDNQIDTMRGLWRKRVLVTGTAVYRPSGRLLRIDAETIKSGENVPNVFSQVPKPSHVKLDLAKLRKGQGPRSGMAAIMGQWPGDENDEQVRVALEKVS